MDENKTLADLLNEENSFRAYANETGKRLQRYSDSVRRIRREMDNLSQVLYRESNNFRKELDVLESLNALGTTPELEEASKHLEQEHPVGTLVTLPGYDLNFDAWEIEEVVWTHPHIYRLKDNDQLWGHSDLVVLTTAPEESPEEVPEDALSES